MYKKEIIDEVSRRTGYTKKDIKNILDSTLDVVTETLIEGEPVILNKFGTFRVGVISEHLSCSPRNPSETIRIKEQRKISFKPSITVKRILNDKE